MQRTFFDLLFIQVLVLASFGLTQNKFLSEDSENPLSRRFMLEMQLTPDNPIEGWWHNNSGDSYLIEESQSVLTMGCYNAVYTRVFEYSVSPQNGKYVAKSKAYNQSTWVMMLSDDNLSMSIAITNVVNGQSEVSNMKLFQGPYDKDMAGYWHDDHKREYLFYDEKNPDNKGETFLRITEMTVANRSLDPFYQKDKLISEAAVKREDGMYKIDVHPVRSPSYSIGLKLSTAGDKAEGYTLQDGEKFPLTLYRGSYY